MDLIEDQFNALYLIAVDSYTFSPQEDKYDERIELLKEMKPFFNTDAIAKGSINHQNDIRIMNVLGYVDTKRYADSSAFIRYGDVKITEYGWCELVAKYEWRKQYSGNKK